MHPDFARLMTEATRLTRAGDLQAATAAIQAALAHGAAPGPHPADGVIDVDARVVDAPSEAALPAAMPTAHTAPAPAPAPAPVSSGTPAPAGVGTQPSAPAAGRPAGAFRASHHAGTHGARDYKLYLPPTLASLPLGQTVPLVVMLHGCTQTPDDFAAGTGMNAAAREQGFVVLYPAQSNGANPGRCWNWFKHNHQKRGKGEPALLADMTRAVMANHPIDPQRVYVAGLSAGGAMAAILGDAYPDLFTAVGVHSGLATGAAHSAQSAFTAMQGGASLPPTAHPPMNRPPTIVFHGDQDTTVHPVNGEQVVARPAGEGAGAQAPQHERGKSTNGREYTRRTWRDARGDTVAEHWVVHGAGHAWSGGHAAGSYTDATGPDATGEMLRFFFAHPRRPEA